ncbi:MAG: hypothetical protein CL583_17645 [Alteromonadaceae bacterium]|nr:hypothetical protein [Alteromonadaceae bacterium]
MPGTFETQIFKGNSALETQGAGASDATTTGGTTLFAQMLGSDDNSATMRRGVDIGAVMKAKPLNYNKPPRLEESSL